MAFAPKTTLNERGLCDWNGRQTHKLRQEQECLMRKFLFIFLSFAAMSGCSMGNKSAPPKPKEVPVTTGTAVAKTIPISIDAVGTVEAFNSVSVLSRVSGQILEIHFKEGVDVQKDAPLIAVDPAPFKEMLREAEARLTRDKAALEFKRAEAERYKFLVEKGAVSKSDYDKNRTDADAQEETIRADEAEVEQARLSLSYCSINAPISGRTGAYLVKEGTIIEASRTPLVVINLIRPIYARFSIPEKYLSDVKKYLAVGTLEVIAQLSGSAAAARDGRLTFIDNAVDPKTGMIQLKAEFPNQEGLLWPGQFVNVQLALTTQKNVVVIPSQAVQVGPKGSYVFVVGGELTVESRIVSVSRIYNDEAVIASGIVPGEIVVTNGQNKLQDGFKVKVKSSLEAASSAK